MNRVSTLGSYQTALLNLMSAQQRGVDAQNRVSSEKVATDLSGFGRGSETLTALRSAQNRIQGFIDTGEAVAERLSTQAVAFDRIGAGADGARQALSDALAAGRVDGLMQELQSQFSVIEQGLNAKHQGRYLFAGAQTDTAPVAVATLADLAALPDAAAAFDHDALKSASRLDEATTVETGFLAGEVGEEIFAIFRDIQAFNAGAGGPIEGQPSEAVAAFLATQVERLGGAYTHITDAAARNGALQNRVDTTLTSHEDHKIALDELVSGRTDADMTQAVTDLKLSQISIEASAQVIAQLRTTSLLDLLKY